MSATSLQQAARAAIAGAGVAPARVRMPDLSPGHVPTTDSQWRAVIYDAGIAPHWARLLAARNRLLTLATAGPAKVGRNAPGQAEAVLTATEQLIAQIEGVCWFVATYDSFVSHHDLHTLARIAHAVACGSIAALVGGSDVAPEALRHGNEIVGSTEREAWRMPTDPPSVALASTFGVDPAIINNLTGLDSGARLRVASGLSAERLNELSRRMLAHLIPDGARYPPPATSIVASLLMCARPLAAHVMALNVCQLLATADPDAAAAVLNQHRRYMPENWATHRTVVNGHKRLAAAGDDDEEAALAEADLSWAVAEGPVRRVAWMVLRLLGARDGALPMLAEIHDRLTARDTPLTALLAISIEPTWRNPVAHRSVSFLASTGHLALAGQAVDPQHLRYRRAVGTALVQGFECGVSLALAAPGRLSARVDRHTSASEHPQIAQSRVADSLAGYGLVAERIEVREQRVTIVLDDATIYDGAKAIIALAGAWHQLRLTDIELRFGAREPLRLEARVLAEVARLQGRGRGLPAVALWPVIATGLVRGGALPEAAYADVAERALRAAIQTVAPLMGVERAETAPSPAAAERELGDILDALLASWRVLPNRVPSHCADVAQRIRVTRTAVRCPTRLRTAARALHLASVQRNLVELPWFAPLHEAL